MSSALGFSHCKWSETFQTFQQLKCHHARRGNVTWKCSRTHHILSGDVWWKLFLESLQRSLLPSELSGSSSVWGKNRTWEMKFLSIVTELLLTWRLFLPIKVSPCSWRCFLDSVLSRTATNTVWEESFNPCDPLPDVRLPSLGILEVLDSSFVGNKCELQCKVPSTLMGLLLPWSLLSAMLLSLLMIKAIMNLTKATVLMLYNRVLGGLCAASQWHNQDLVRWIDFIEQGLWSIQPNIRVGGLVCGLREFYILSLTGQSVFCSLWAVPAVTIPRCAQHPCLSMRLTSLMILLFAMMLGFRHTTARNWLG